MYGSYSVVGVVGWLDESGRPDDPDSSQQACDAQP